MPNAINGVDRSGRATASPKPQGKANLLHQQILGALVENKRGRLANNVSNENVERAARRWSSGVAAVSESVERFQRSSGAA